MTADNEIGSNLRNPRDNFVGCSKQPGTHGWP